MPELGAYRHVWTKRNRDGDWEYGYDCWWSDGTKSHEFTLPWGRLEGVIELPMK